jgi:alkaline phosphatase
MVEGGRIDHALHANNAKRALQETKAFNDAIQTALDKVDLSNTLIVVTADHDHVMTFNGYAARTGQTTETNPGILGLSYDYNIAKEQNAYSKVLADGQVHNPYRDVNGATGTTLVFGNGTGKRLDIRDSISNEQAFADDYKQEVGVQLTKSETHGGGDVMLFAEGKNSNLFKGTQENTWVFEQLKKAFGF